EQRRLQKDVAKYIEWNPICRCFLEQLLLAIRRHGILHPMASSYKGPKWADYYIGAFIGIADRLVTDDVRLRRALEEHRQLRERAPWLLNSLEEFHNEVRCGVLFSHSGTGGF